MSLYKRLLTQLDGKMGPALRVAYTDVGEERKLGRGSFVPEKAPLGVARCSFRATTKTSGTFLSVSPVGVRHRDVSSKPRASRLDWHIFRDNSNKLIRVNRP